MTNLQIRVVLLTAELGSISSAAKELNVSQPNASSCIKQLEDELGFQIFYRTASGVDLTQKGFLFLEHGRKILEEQTKILDIRSADEIYQLRVGSCNYSSCILPLLKLCEKHRKDLESDFCYVKVSIEQGIQALINRTLDVVIAPALQHQITGLARECKKNNISSDYICTMPTEITVRKGHPALADRRCENLKQGSDVMRDYPYIAYRNLEEDVGSTGYSDSDYIQCSYKIFVDDFDSRLRFLRASNGFAFGIKTSEKYLNEYNLTALPVSEVSVDIFALTRISDADRRETNEYIKLLSNELKMQLKL